MPRTVILTFIASIAICLTGAAALGVCVLRFRSKELNSAVTAVKADLSNKDAVAAALKKADFTSLRGGFKFNTNGYPIQDFYLTKVAKRADGKFQTEIVQKVFENYGDRYAKDCAAGK